MKEEVAKIEPANVAVEETVDAAKELRKQKAQERMAALKLKMEGAK